MFQQVPPPYTPIVGRAAEIDDLVAMVSDRRARVVTLVGTGGIGRSRLAIEVALRAGPQFPDGVALVALENVVDSKLLLPSIAKALGIGESGEASIEERLPIALSQRRVLIVVDNFEQLVDAAPVLVGLYADAPESTFLVTSRAVLRIRGEQVYQLNGLSLGTPDWLCWRRRRTGRHGRTARAGAAESADRGTRHATALSWAVRMRRPT